MPTITKPTYKPISVVDLRRTGNEPGHCERCGRNDLRFLHTVQNCAGRKKQVGRECAKRLCYGYRPERQERRLINLWNRRSHWLTRNWATSRNGNDTLTFKSGDDQVRVTVYEDKYAMGFWSYCITVDDEPFFPPGKFASSDEAKLAAFDRLAEAAGW